MIKNSVFRSYVLKWHRIICKKNAFNKVENKIMSVDT